MIVHIHKTEMDNYGHFFRFDVRLNGSTFSYTDYLVFKHYLRNLPTTCYFASDTNTNFFFIPAVNDFILMKLSCPDIGFKAIGFQNESESC